MLPTVNNATPRYTTSAPAFENRWFCASRQRRCTTLNIVAIRNPCTSTVYTVGRIVPLKNGTGRNESIPLRSACTRSCSGSSCWIRPKNVGRIVRNSKNVIPIRDRFGSTKYSTTTIPIDVIDASRGFGDTIPATIAVMWYTSTDMKNTR